MHLWHLEQLEEESSLKSGAGTEWHHIHCRCRSSTDGDVSGIEKSLAVVIE